MRFSSYLCTVVPVFKRRLRLELFFSRMWLCPLLRRLSLPFLVTSKRPAAPLWVFIFGICFPPRLSHYDLGSRHGSSRFASEYPQGPSSSAYIPTTGAFVFTSGAIVSKSYVSRGRRSFGAGFRSRPGARPWGARPFS